MRPVDPVIDEAVKLHEKLAVGSEGRGYSWASCSVEPQSQFSIGGSHIFRDLAMEDNTQILPKRRSTLFVHSVRRNTGGAEAVARKMASRTTRWLIGLTGVMRAHAEARRHRGWQLWRQAQLFKKITYRGTCGGRASHFHRLFGEALPL